MASDTTLAWPEDGTLTHSSGQGPQDSMETENGFLWGAQSWRCGVAIVMGSLCVGILAWQPWAGDLEGALRGAPLSAPVNAAEPYPAARPEWHFLFLYQF